jgi:solute:Na+ symporter, SSS family
LPLGDAPGVHGGWITIVHQYPVDMAQNFWGAIYAFMAALIATVVISLATPRTKTDEELKGLVLFPDAEDQGRGVPWFKHPAVLGVIVIAACVILNIIFR